jgi:exopolysaccharide production protein ExoQ
MTSTADAENESAGWMWLAALTLTGVFFLATHDPLASLQWRRTIPEEVRELVREVSEGRMQRRLAFPLLGAFGGIGLVLRSKLRFRPDPVLAGLLAAFLSWQFMSVAWAADPLLTAKRLVVLGMMVMGAAGMVRHLSLTSLLRALAICTALNVGVGVAAEVWLGTFEPFGAGYRFAGTLHPNQQGINCALLALSAVYLLRAASSPRVRALAFAALWVAISFLVLTRSRTALTAAILALLVFLALDATHLRRIALGAGATSAFALLLLLGANGMLPAFRDALLLGRDESSLATLTGRTDIWSYGLRHVLDRPIAGHGYNSFWSARHTAEVSQLVDWKISEGHSAYLDTLLNLGAVGLLLFVSLFALAIVAALVRHRSSCDPAYAVVAAVVAFGALDGLLESAIFIPNLLSFLILTLIGALAFGGRRERDVYLAPTIALERVRTAV